MHKQSTAASRSSEHMQSLGDVESYRCCMTSNINGKQERLCGGNILYMQC